MVKPGYEFSGPDDPRLPGAIKRLRVAEREAWIAAYHARFTVVETCAGCARPLVEEERDAHALSHLNPKSRRLLGRLLQSPPEVVAEVTRFLTDGRLRR